MRFLSVTVIVPTYNRGYIIEKTIPTYIQEDVEELIVVNDASTDDTDMVMERLKKRYPIIKYIKQKRNTGQTGAQNRALKEVKTDYVYFGDDDSILLPGTIKYLLETMKNKKADIVGAMPLYADTLNDIHNVNSFIERKAPILKNMNEMIDLYHLEKVCFFYRFKEPIKVPFTHACALVKKEYIKKVKFDTNFKGNAYREETDFFLTCDELGASIWFDSRGCQINYPFSEIKRIRTISSMFKHARYDLVNTIKLINKHHWWFVEKYGYKYSKNKMILLYIFNDCLMYAKLLPNRLCNIIRRKFNI